MSPEAQRIAIAEACGWSQIKNFHTMKIGGMWLGYPPVNPIIGEPTAIPDYLNDLNQMHEAERQASLGLIRCAAYESLLKEIITRDFQSKTPETRVAELYTWHATATQRAEALLKTLGLWKDDDQMRDGVGSTTVPAKYHPMTPSEVPAKSQNPASVGEKGGV